MILTICPYSGKRLYELERMKESFYKTSYEDNQLVIISRGTVTEAINLAFKENYSAKYFHITNDDVIYKTKGWDTKFINILEEYGNGIAYGDDLIQGKNLCTFPFISGDIARALGWLQLPTLNRYCGDVVWKFLGQSLDILYYVPEVIIHHQWKEEEMDKELGLLDMQRYAKWLPHAYKDINKIKEIL
jgi:hypothetical protein